MPETAVSKGITSRVDPYKENFAQAAQTISQYEELFQIFLDAKMSFETPEALTESDVEYFEQLFNIFGLNFHAVEYYTVDKDAESMFPFFKYSRAWSKVTDTGRKDHPSFWRFKAQVFLREEDKTNRWLIIHELSHTFGDLVAEGLVFTNAQILENEINLNPILYANSPFEISLWNNLMREGLAILFESADTIPLDENLRATELKLDQEDIEKLRKLFPIKKLDRMWIR